MNKLTCERAIKAADYCIETGATVREIARVFGVSKSTIHNDLNIKIPQIDSGRAKKIKNIFQKHTEERHLKGGQQTKLRWQKHKSENCQ